MNVTSSVGGVAVLSCQVEGSMRHNLTWHRAGRVVQAPAGRVKLLSNSSLQIAEVRTQDAGEYNCVAANAHGHSRITVWLLVPGMLGRCPAGHLLKHLTRWSLMALTGPQHLVSIIGLTSSQSYRATSCSENAFHQTELMHV